MAQLTSLEEIMSLTESEHDYQNRIRNAPLCHRHRCTQQHEYSRSRSQSRSQSVSEEEGRLLDTYRRKSTTIDIGEFQPIRKYYKYQEFDEDNHYLTRLQREHLESGTDTCCYGCFKGIGQSGQIYWSNYTFSCTCMMGYYQDLYHRQGIFFRSYFVFLGFLHLIL